MQGYAQSKNPLHDPNSSLAQKLTYTTAVAQIFLKWTHDERLARRALHASIQEEHILLTGTVYTPEEKRLAESLAKSISPPLPLVNNIEVRAPKRPMIVYTPSPTIRYHRVRRGESLWSIAKKYGVSIRALKRWNQLSNSRIQIGQRLKIRQQNK